MTPLLALSPEALADALGGPGRAQAVLRTLRAGRDPFEPGELPRSLAARLRAHAAPTEARMVAEHRAEDGTVKRLLALADGREVEMVVIPSPERSTVCVSSQVGCLRGCRFCLTGTMGLLRSLTADEIAAQVVAAQAVVRAHGLAPLRNVVFMGMGEPLDNFENVAQAIALIARSDGLGVGHRHVTVSTVGPTVHQVRRLAELPTHVAWSLHAAEDGLRSRLVPTARTPVAELRDALAEVLAPRRAPLFVEVTLLAELNDQPAHADAIAQLFAEFPTEVRLNLIPMNPIPGNETLTPSPEPRVEAFAQRLRAAGLFVTTRRARGADARSACGQLVSAGSGRRGRVPVLEP